MNRAITKLKVLIVSGTAAEFEQHVQSSPAEQKNRKARIGWQLICAWSYLTDVCISNNVLALESPIFLEGIIRDRTENKEKCPGIARCSVIVLQDSPTLCYRGIFSCLQKWDIIRKLYSYGTEKSNWDCAFISETVAPLWR
ncbi:Hypothetical predicted protein, partial [Pelobates cultripes]